MVCSINNSMGEESMSVEDYKSKATLLFERLQSLQQSSSNMLYSKNQIEMTQISQLYKAFQSENSCKEECYKSMLARVDELQKQIEMNKNRLQECDVKIESALNQAGVSLDNVLSRTAKESQKREHSLRTSLMAKVQRFELKYRQMPGVFDGKLFEETLHQLQKYEEQKNRRNRQAICQVKVDAKRMIGQYKRMMGDKPKNEIQLKGMLDRVTQQIYVRIDKLKDKRKHVEEQMLMMIEKAVENCQVKRRI